MKANIAKVPATATWPSESNLNSSLYTDSHSWLCHQNFHWLQGTTSVAVSIKGASGATSAGQQGPHYTVGTNPLCSLRLQSESTDQR